MNWLSSSGGLFWIFGKPGSGKSTLMDYFVHKNRILSYLQQHSPRSWIVLRFFFDFRTGKDVTNNLEGLLRSLLYQLIKEMPQVNVLGLNDSEKDSISGWPKHRLRDALHTSLESAKKGVCILVDGLDEYEGSVLELVPFLQSLATSSDSESFPIKICVSSRPEPVISELLQHVPQLSMSDHNAHGIRSYCSLTLKEIRLAVLGGLNILQISQIIAERAEGVFLWARFALEELIQGNSSGETFEEMSERLNSIPDSLEGIYARILGRIQPLAKKECMIMLQLVCFAKWPLSWQEHHAATEFAIGKDVVIFEPINDDKDPASMARKYDTFAKRLRAKAVGLLELVKEEHRNKIDIQSVKLIHRSVSTYLDQRGWQMLGESESYNPAVHESWYLGVCTRYLHRLLRHFKLEKPTNQWHWTCWMKFNLKGLYDRVGMEENQAETSYPFLIYCAGQIFDHARSLEKHGVSSYLLLHDSFTEQLVGLHAFFGRYKTVIGCFPCTIAPLPELVFEDFDPIYVAFQHGLASYCKDDLATTARAPSQYFWDRALRCAIYSSEARDSESSPELVSLALQNITTVQQHHIEDSLDITASTRGLTMVLELVLHHESVKDLRLTDGEGQEVKLLWLFALSGLLERKEVLIEFIEAAKRRGEDVRQPCGPEGNMIETLLKRRPSRGRRVKLTQLREYYESMSWPFEYDADEIERSSLYG